MNETAVLIQFDSLTHREVPVTPETYAKFAAALPEGVTLPILPENRAVTLGDVADTIHDYMADFVYKCQRRPALPHEEECRGGFYLTKKGSAKYNDRLRALANAFEQAFGYSVQRNDSWGPINGPLDPLTYG